MALFKATESKASNRAVLFNRYHYRRDKVFLRTRFSFSTWPMSIRRFNSSYLVLDVNWDTSTLLVFHREFFLKVWFYHMRFGQAVSGYKTRNFSAIFICSESNSGVILLIHLLNFSLSLLSSSGWSICCIRSPRPSRLSRPRAKVDRLELSLWNS